MNSLTRDEIKATTTVPQVLQQYGIEVKRGRCKGFCHDGKDLNVKVTNDFYYCYVCGKGMDIFDITMELNHCDFRTAFELLGGTEKPSFRAIVKADKARKEREDIIAKESRERSVMANIRGFITAYRNIIASEIPFSDSYCYCQNKLQYQLYLLDLQIEKR